MDRTRRFAAAKAAMRLGVIALALALAALFRIPSAGAEIRFSSDFDAIPSMGTVGPTALSAADVNGDGLEDLLSCNYGTGPLILHRGIGARRWAAPESLNLGARLPQTFAVVDLNRDGRKDLVVAEHNEVTTFLGNGNGTFGSRRVVLSLIKSLSLLVKDLDGDGDPDLAAGYLYGPVVVARGLGDGRFAVTAVLQDVAGFLGTIASGDLDDDGTLDLVVANSSSNSVDFLRGLPGLTFAPVVSLAAPAGPADVRTGDLDEDGVTDFVVASTNAGSVSAFHGTPGGNPAAGVVLPGHTYTRSVQLVDLDHDGHLDLTSMRSGLIRACRGRGDGTFFSPTEYPAAAAPEATFAGDLDGDGHTDLLAGSVQTLLMSVSFGNGDGSFGANSAYGTVQNYFDVVVGDVNQDGRTDILTGGSNKSTLGAHLGTAGATFGSYTITTGLDTHAMQYSELADLRGNGSLDLVATKAYYSYLLVVRGDGAGNFSPGYLLQLPYEPSELAVRDFDDDGRPDVAFTMWSGVGVVRGTPTGAPSPPIVSGPSARIMTVSDFDGDGALDVATSYSNRLSEFSYPVRVSLGNGDGTFTLTNTFTAGAIPSCLAAADLDLDGIQDLASANVGDGTITLFRGNGDGTFTAWPPVHAADAYRIALEDLDFDGRADLTALEEGTISFWRGRGDGTFEFALRIGTRRTLRMRVQDVNGDALPDVVVGHEVPDSVFSVYLNRSPLPGASIEPPSGGSTVLLGPVAKDGASGMLRVRVTLPDRRPARLSVIDVSGRAVAGSLVEPLGAGAQEVTLALRRPLSHGILWLKLSHPAGSAVQRIVWLR